MDSKREADSLLWNFTISGPGYRLRGRIAVVLGMSGVRVAALTETGGLIGDPVVLEKITCDGLLKAFEWALAVAIQEAQPTVTA